MYDAVTIYGSALNALGLEEGANITCDQDDGWEFGSSIINYIRTVSCGFCITFVSPKYVNKKNVPV